MFDLAAIFVHYTDRHIFLAGRAGTGKTTFLRRIKETCHKKLVVLAPTGVAAINAGGITIHSFLRLPWACFLPAENDLVDTPQGKTQFLSQRSLRMQFKFRKERVDLIRELELIILDEVSMIRADLLDCIDYTLRYIRKSSQPFGGVQMLFIGDMLQLPPVLSDEEEPILRRYYQSHYVFDSWAMRQARPIYIELDRVFRQSDAAFIGLLNKIRNNQFDAADLDKLNSRCNPQFLPAAADEYITLASHNYIADQINDRELDKLDTVLCCFDAELEGNFPESMYPAEERLWLKVGAQVMFLRNDRSPERRYYNGKIGRVESIDPEERVVFIRFKDEEELLELQPDTWLNIKYVYDREKDRIDEETLGSFSQFPLRLAWAITIHKSQGLTFDKAIVDASQSFSSGQVYVALSRLSNFEGLVLRSPIRPSSVQVDPLLLNFSQRMQLGEGLDSILEREQESYLQKRIAQSFDLFPLRLLLADYLAEQKPQLSEEENEEDALPLSKLETALQKLTEASQIGERFMKQLEYIVQMQSQQQDAKQLQHKRVGEARSWFTHLLSTELQPLCEEFFEALKVQTRNGRKRRAFADILTAIEQQLERIAKAERIAKMLCEERTMDELLQGITQGLEAEPDEQSTSQQEPTSPAKKKRPKKEAGESKRESLRLFREGLSIAEIAAQRELRDTTIEGHLITAMMDGEISPIDLVSERRILMIEDFFKRQGSVPTLREAYDFLEQEYSFFELKVARHCFLSDPSNTSTSTAFHTVE